MKSLWRFEMECDNFGKLTRTGFQHQTIETKMQ